MQKIKTFPLEAVETCSVLKSKFIIRFPCMAGPRKNKTVGYDCVLVNRVVVSLPLFNRAQTEPVLNRHLLDFFLHLHV